MTDVISRKAAMELRDSLADIIGARPMSSIHSALSEYRKAIAALPAQPAQGEAVAHCGYCDGTGDVVRIDGEWLGTCHCPAGTPTPPDSAELDALVDQAKGRSRFCRDRGEVKSPEIIERLADAILALRDKPAPAVTVQEAAKALLAEWQDSKTTQADDIAQDEADTHQPDDFDASKIVEVWLRAIAGGGDE